MLQHPSACSPLSHGCRPDPGVAPFTVQCCRSQRCSRCSLRVEGTSGCWVCSGGKATHAATPGAPTLRIITVRHTLIAARITVVPGFR